MPAWFHARVADGHTILVAERSHEPIGFAVFGANSLDVEAGAELRNVYVDQNAASSGIGRELVQACEARLRDAGVTSVSLGVFPQNVRAIAFYKRLGYAKVRLTTWMNNGSEFADQIMLKEL